MISARALKSTREGARAPLGEEFVGLALLRVVLVEIRVKHPHQLLPKLFQPRRLLRVEFPFRLQRRRRGIVFPILLRRLALIVSGGPSGGFLALSQQALLLYRLGIVEMRNLTPFQ